MLDQPVSYKKKNNDVNPYFSLSQLISNFMASIDNLYSVPYAIEIMYGVLIGL